MNDCEKYAALLDAFIDGECSPEEAERVREHLKTCPACQNEVEMALAIRDAFPDAEDVEVPAAFSASVMEAIRSGGAPRIRKRPWKRALLSLAACCAIAVLICFTPFRDAFQSSATKACLAAGSAADASGSASSENQADISGEARAFSGVMDRSLPTQKTDGTAGSETSGSSVKEPAATPKKSTSSSPKKSTPAVSAPETPSAAGGGGANAGSSAGTGDNDAADAQPDTRETLTGMAVGGGGTSDNSDPSSSQTTEGSQPAQPIYRKWASLRTEDVGTALDQYTGTVSQDASTGITTTVYELEEADFDAVITQLNAADQVTVDDTADTTLCCISVSS